MSAKVNLKPYRQALEALLSHQTTAKMSTLLGSAAANLDDPWLRGQLKTIINNIRVDSDRRSEARRLIRMLPHTFESEQLNELIEYIEDVIDANESAWEILASRYGWESPGESTGEKTTEERWCVTMNDISGVPGVVIAPSRKVAIEHFMQTVYLFLHAAPDQLFRVIGNDDDAALAGLHLVMNVGEAWVCLAALTRPGEIDPDCDLATEAGNAQSFVASASLIQSAIELTQGSLEVNEVERLSHSVAMLKVYRPLADIFAKEVEEVGETQSQEEKAIKTWDDMASIRHMVSLTATIK